MTLLYLQLLHSCWWILGFLTPSSVALRCVQCSSTSEGLELPGSKRQLRLTTGLSQGRCDKQVEINCEEGRDVCVSQTLKADSGDWWVVKGCDYSSAYDQVGCQTAKTSRSKTVLHNTRTVSGDSPSEQKICVCRTNSCNTAASRHWPPPILLGFLTTLILRCLV